jgi:hypothetical protein
MFFCFILLLIPIYVYSQDNNTETDNSESDNDDNHNGDNTNKNTDDINNESDSDSDYTNDPDIQDFWIEPYSIILPEIVYDKNNVRVEYAGGTSIFTPIKDPFVSSMLSFMWMGLGQIYVGEKTITGTLLFASEFLFIAGGISTFFILQAQYSTYDDPMVNWYEFSGESKLLVISLLLSYVALKVYNVLDSYEQAIEYNRKYFGSGYDSEFLMYFTFDISSFSLTIRF